MDYLTTYECLRRYAGPEYQPLLEKYGGYPYPNADGIELESALKSAALNLDEVVTKKLLHQLAYSSFGTTDVRDDEKVPLRCVREAKKAVERVACVDSRFDAILKRFTKSEKLFLLRIKECSVKIFQLIFGFF